MLNRLFNALSKSRKGFSGLFSKIKGKSIPPEAYDQIEELLITSDMGLETVDLVLSRLRRVDKNSDYQTELRSLLIDLLPDKFETLKNNQKLIILMLGVNGAGKTTTAAKLAKHYKNRGNKTLLIAADTYRAGAVEQLQIWANRAQVDIVSTGDKSKSPATVLFSGLEEAIKFDADVVIVDTAGRLQNNDNLMKELIKMVTVIEKRFKQFELKNTIVLDASLGQNSFNQVTTFGENINIDSIILSKIDGTAKGGVLFPIHKNLKIPVSYLCTGETITDLESFDPEVYVDGLLGIE